MQTHEYFDDRGGHFLVHREVAAVQSFGIGKTPICGVAQAPHLSRDGRTRFVFPFPHALVECFSSQIVARLSFGLQLALNHNLRRDARVIGADDPVGVVPAHAVIANERIHQCLLERVAHVQGPGHIGRRQLDAVRRFVGVV